MITRIQSARVPTPGTAYSQALMAQGSKLLFISGQVHQVFRNLQANLEAGGATWTQVVKLTVLLTDIGDFPVFNEVRQEYLQPDYPTATTMAVSALVRPEWKIEIEAIAVLD